MRGGREGGRDRGGGKLLSVSKFKRPLWRAARARTSVMFSLGFDFPVFSKWRR